MAIERVFIDGQSVLEDTDFAEVVAEKVLVYMQDSKVGFHVGVLM